MQPWGMNQVGSIAAPWLEWQGAGGSARRPLDRPLGIGRDPSSDICLPELSVSRRHAVVSLVGGQIVVDASSSQNGIVLGDSRVPRATVVAGQPFVIGETTFRVVAGPTAQPGATGYPGLIAAPLASAGTTPAAVSDRSILGSFPLTLVVAGIAIVAIVAVVLVVRSGGSGGISFDPSTVSCSSPVAFTSTVQLPSSVHAGDTLTATLDGRTMTTGPIGTSAVQQADGSWTITNTSSVATMQSVCALGGSAGGVNVLTPGTHTEQILDSTGKVLATGSYTVTP
jgi:hypothetical protein